jgi:hypothetical protein
VTLWYPPLFNLVESREQIANAFPWSIVGQNRGGFCNWNPVGSAVRTNIEYFAPGLDFYFYTNDAQEIAMVDAGLAGFGWLRTGKSFDAETAPNCSDGQSAVYRFWGLPGIGARSHFFTRDARECSVVDRSAAWTFEDVAF